MKFFAFTFCLLQLLQCSLGERLDNVPANISGKPIILFDGDRCRVKVSLPFEPSESSRVYVVGLDRKLIVSVKDKDCPDDESVTTNSFRSEFTIPPSCIVKNGYKYPFTYDDREISVTLKRDPKIKSDEMKRDEVLVNKYIHSFRGSTSGAALLPVPFQQSSNMAAVRKYSQFMEKKLDMAEDEDEGCDDDDDDDDDDDFDDDDFDDDDDEDEDDDDDDDYDDEDEDDFDEESDHEFYESDADDDDDDDLESDDDTSDDNEIEVFEKNDEDAADDNEDAIVGREEEDEDVDDATDVAEADEGLENDEMDDAEDEGLENEEVDDAEDDLNDAEDLENEVDDDEN